MGANHQGLGEDSKTWKSSQSSLFGERTSFRIGSDNKEHWKSASHLRRYFLMFSFLTYISSASITILDSLKNANWSCASQQTRTLERNRNWLLFVLCTFLADRPKWPKAKTNQWVFRQLGLVRTSIGLTPSQSIPLKFAYSTACICQDK